MATESDTEDEGVGRLRALATAVGPDQARLVAAVEHDLAEMRRDLEAARGDLAASVEAHRAFLHSVTHDLRAPLRAIDGFARLLEQGCGAQLDGEHREFLTIICENTATMNDQINALLDLARLELCPLVPTVVDMTDLARGVVDEIRRRSPERTVEVEIDALPCAAADVDSMRRVLIELVGNAWKFTRRKAAPRVEIGARADVAAEDVYFVRDNGDGFAPNGAVRLFTIFRRLHKPKEFEGLGVGLAAVRTIVGRHGGRVWAEAAQGESATFYFSLPRQPQTSRP
jgi:light-regulated signal transduction histidine kinase (bacteriophytochrome)